MKRFLAILLTVTMIVPMMTVFLSLGGSAAEAVYDKPLSTTDAAAGLTFDGTVDNGKNCADDNYRALKRLREVPHTFQAWVYIPEAYQSTSPGTVISNYTTKNDTRGAYISLEITKNRVPMIAYFDDILVDHEVKFKKSAVPVAKWTMVTIVWDGETGYVSCYLNGKLSESVCFLPDMDVHVIECPMAIGGDFRTMNTNYFKGGLQDLSMYSTARTAEQVAADYEKGVNISDPELLCHYDVDASDDGQDVADASGHGYTMYYSKTWLTEEEMEAIRAQYTFTPSYSFAAIGDTQKTTYREAITKRITTPTAANSATYRMYQWLAENKAEKNIQMVMGMGDITDANLDPEWALIKASISQLDDAGVAYTLIRGNHDSYTYTNSGYVGRGDEGFDEYFGSGTAYYGQIANHGGFYDSSSVRNIYYRLEVNGTKWMIIGLDYRANDSVMAWAGNLCNTYSDHKVIITTHIYLNAEGDPISYGGLSDSPNNGDDKWNKLAAKYSNVEMVLSGHIGSDRLVTTQVKGVNGNTVTQMLIDSQDSDGMLGGMGYIALYRFNADGSEFYTEYYSVEKDRYMLTANQFYVDLEAEGEELEATKWDLQRGRKPSGNGTEEEPFIISHPEHLAWMAYQVDATDHAVCFYQHHFVQVCDIDLQGNVIQSIGGYFKNATGDASALNVKAFGGHYNGNGYVIKNGTITPCHPDQSFNKRKQFGLFGCIYGATIENVTLEDVVVVGRGPTGAIVGKAMAPWDGSGHAKFNQIIGCHVGEGVEIRTWHPDMIYDATYDGAFRAGVVGGICGIAYATTIQGCTAENTIRVSGPFGMVGGIAGTAGYNTVIDHCAFAGGIELVDTTYAASVSIGGIVGCMSPHTGSQPDQDRISPMAGTLHITNCYNSGYYEYTGDVAITVVDTAKGYNRNNKNIHWGGIIGHAGSMIEIEPTDTVPMPYLIENCYNLYSETRGTLEQSTAKYVTGGIVGRSVANVNSSSVFWLKNCHSVKVDAGGLSTTTSTNEYRCDATGLSSEGKAAVQVVQDAEGNGTVYTKTLEQMRLDILAIDAMILRIQSGTEEVGATWRVGKGAPVATANVGDLYLDTDTGDVYLYLSEAVNGVYAYTAWPLVANIKGADGIDGTNGADGADGIGNTWTVGDGVPVALANAGDMYYDKVSCNVYQFRNGVWKLVGNLKGADGQDGVPGQNGQDGNRWYTGTVYPSITAAHRVGDMYMNTATGEIYRFSGTIWASIGNLTGPKGEQGEVGPRGEKGEKGEDGADAALSDSSNTADTKLTVDDSAAKSKPNKSDGLALAALIIGIVLLIGNAVFMVLYFLGKKKKA